MPSEVTSSSANHQGSSGGARTHRGAGYAQGEVWGVDGRGTGGHGGQGGTASVS